MKKITCTVAALTMFLVGASAIADDFVSVTGPNESFAINSEAFDNTNRPLIFVRENVKGSLELIAPMPQAGPQQALAQASQKWLSNPANLSALQAELPVALEQYKVSGLENDISKLDFVNAWLQHWTETSGAQDSVLQSMNNKDTTAEGGMPCTSTEDFYQICAGEPFPKCWYYCDSAGRDCCVIDTTVGAGLSTSLTPKLR